MVAALMVVPLEVAVREALAARTDCREPQREPALAEQAEPAHKAALEGPVQITRSPQPETVETEGAAGAQELAPELAAPPEDNLVVTVVASAREGQARQEVHREEMLALQEPADKLL